MSPRPVAHIDGDLQEVEEELHLLRERLDELAQQRLNLLDEREAALLAATTKHDTDRPTLAAGVPTTAYIGTNFAWSAELRATAAQVWQIASFRPLQLPTMNATLDGRDVFVIMPTGGGKSLCYQLPALLSPGVTVVVSPLIALIQDQVFGLRDVGVPVGMLTSSTPNDEAKAVTDGLRRLALAKPGSTPPSDAVKLVYVTPEKIAKSKRFMALLEKLYHAGRLARIVVDECHCCSQFGHDFRPDYKKLGILRTVFPKVPIMALTATCPVTVLSSIVEILGMHPLAASITADVQGGYREDVVGRVTSAAHPGGTLLLTSPLYRPNLTYQVLPKPAALADQITEMAAWIERHHAGQSGIVYCLARREAETVADGLAKASEGRIKTGVYHADLDDGYKARIHELWRKGRLAVVVATIAFGMGINLGTVRFVLHHSLSKSIESYYQESGRGGRDGLPATCALLYRSADASRLTTWTVTDQDGLDNAQQMIRYAEDPATCRKCLFETYFSQAKGSYFSRVPTRRELAVVETAAAASSFAPREYAGLPGITTKAAEGERCGQCDNCQQLDRLYAKDVGSCVLSLCRLVQKHLQMTEEKLTFLKLADLWCRKTSRVPLVKSMIDAGEVTLAPLDQLRRAECERIVNKCILDGYLKEEFSFTSYATHAYIAVGPRGKTLLRTHANPPDPPPVVTMQFVRTVDATMIPGPPAQEPRTRKTSARQPAVKETKKRKTERIIVSSDGESCAHHNDEDGDFIVI